MVRFGDLNVKPKPSVQRLVVQMGISCMRTSTILLRNFEPWWHIWFDNLGNQIVICHCRTHRTTASSVMIWLLPGLCLKFLQVMMFSWITALVHRIDWSPRGNCERRDVSTFCSAQKSVVWLESEDSLMKRIGWLLEVPFQIGWWIFLVLRLSSRMLRRTPWNWIKHKLEQTPCYWLCSLSPGRDGWRHIFSCVMLCVCLVLELVLLLLLLPSHPATGRAYLPPVKGRCSISAAIYFVW